jgi:glucosamine--fructose-6-phosphate aminotransferase (isomerizing)
MSESSPISNSASPFEVREFPHAMLREIYEQPDAIRRTLELYVPRGTNGPELNAEFFSPLAEWGNPHGEVLIAASGSSRHSGLAGEITLEDQCGLAVDVEYASEYSLRAGNAKDPRNPSVIVLSQSGETSDTLAALREARLRGQKTLAITNVEDSTMAREADLSMPLGAGREKAIPATKSFTCQLTVLALLSVYEGVALNRLDAAMLSARLKDLEAIPDALAVQIPAWEKQMELLAKKYRDAATFLFLGRGIHYAIAREGALKLKEASYVHAEGYPTGELKHGPNALVSDKTPLVVLATVDHSSEGSVLRYEKTLQLLADMKKQGARVIALANSGDTEVPSLVTDTVFVTSGPEHLLPITEVVPLQLFAYFMALEHGVNVDQPRNLAKAVVEKTA